MVERVYLDKNEFQSTLAITIQYRELELKGMALNTGVKFDSGCLFYCSVCSVLS